MSIPEGKQTTQLYSPTVFLCLSVKTNYFMSHLQLATTRQLGLYSQAGDVFSSGIYSPHCCPARKTSSHSPADPKLNKENARVRSEASLPWKELSVENVSGKKTSSLNRSRHIFQLNSERWHKEKNKIESRRLFWPFTCWCSSCKYNMTLTVNEFNEVRSTKAERAGLNQANIYNFHLKCILEMLSAESRGHKRLSDLSQ